MEDGWDNVDHVTEMAKFFTHWTFMPYIIMVYAGISIVGGVVGICGIIFEQELIMQVAIGMGAASLILAFILLIFFSVVSCFYWLCRCCVEKTIEDVKVELTENTTLKIELGKGSIMNSLALG